MRVIWGSFRPACCHDLLRKAFGDFDLDHDLSVEVKVKTMETMVENVSIQVWKTRKIMPK